MIPSVRSWYHSKREVLELLRRYNDTMIHAQAEMDYFSFRFVSGTPLTRTLFFFVCVLEIDAYEN